MAANVENSVRLTLNWLSVESFCGAAGALPEAGARARVGTKSSVETRKTTVRRIKATLEERV
jgi:hypothetical protein